MTGTRKGFLSCLELYSVLRMSALHAWPFSVIVLLFSMCSVDGMLVTRPPPPQVHERTRVVRSTQRGGAEPQRGRVGQVQDPPSVSKKSEQSNAQAAPALQGPGDEGNERYTRALVKHVSTRNP